CHRLRHPTRPVSDRPLRVLGSHSPDRRRDRPRLRPDPWGRARLRRSRTGGVRWAHVVRLSAAAPERGCTHGSCSRRVDLPRRPECLPALSHRLQRRRALMVSLRLLWLAVFLTLFSPCVVIVAFVVVIGYGIGMTTFPSGDSLRG